jgi:hypothetical protein
VENTKETMIESTVKPVQIFSVDCLEGFDMVSPTEKQIKFANTIAQDLGVDFPQSSKEFTKRTYRMFIKMHYDEWKDKFDWSSWGEDEMDWFQMLNG